MMSFKFIHLPVFYDEMCVWRELDVFCFKVSGNPNLLLLFYLFRQSLENLGNLFSTSTQD